MARIMLCDARGPLNDLLDKLGGLAGDRWLTQLKLVLRNGVSFPQWMNTLLTTDLDTSCIDLGPRAKEILIRLSPVVVHQRYQTVIVKLAPPDLGFRPGHDYRDLFEAAKELGLQLCPPQIVPQIRRIYHEQLVGERLYVAMRPINDLVFVLDNQGRTPCLYGMRPDTYTGHSWLFVQSIIEER